MLPAAIPNLIQNKYMLHIELEWNCDLNVYVSRSESGNTNEKWQISSENWKRHLNLFTELKDKKQLK